MVKFKVIATEDNITITLAEVRSTKKLIIEKSDLNENIKMVSTDSIYDEIRNQIKKTYGVETFEIKFDIDNETKIKIASIARHNKDTFDAM